MKAALRCTDKEDIVHFISENAIGILNLCHIPEDGRLKTLSFSTTDMERVSDVLKFGERVDGSNLFSFIEAGKSDIYIMPRVDRAFVNPFSAIATLNVMCDYLDEYGKPLDVAPKNVLARAEEQLRLKTGAVLKGLAELEFYVFSKEEDKPLFSGAPDKNYHESSPFARFENLRNEVLSTLAEVGITSKYGHAEVGKVNTKAGVLMEQQEVEFALQSLPELADNIAIAKWVIRNVCVKYGVSASFSPKVSLENAGTGMHIHLCGVKDGKNIVANARGDLSNEALEMIGGILKFASSVSAFGNPTPVSYLRFIARKESPMHICWSARNRLALIRIPLWWNHLKKSEGKPSLKETFEYRAPDAFANAYLLFAGLVLAVEYGLENSEETLGIAENLRVDGGGDGTKRFKVLPRSCGESAKMLMKDRRFYEEHDVFPKKLIDKTVETLKSFKDKDLWKSLAGKPEKVDEMLKQYLHYG